MKQSYRGGRNYVAHFEEHNGQQDEHGNPTYSNDRHWRRVVSGWWCDVQTTTGGETPSGRSMSTTTTHVLVGEYYGAQNVQPNHRCFINGDQYEVVSVMDRDGLRRDMQIEVKRTVL